jgi:hypothetical protein
MNYRAYLSIVIPFLILTLTPQSEPSFGTVKICDVQGHGYTSPYANEHVTVVGVTTADFDQLSLKGFFIQQDRCDMDSNTSDGLFILLPERIDIVSSGQRVQVTGLVEEFFGRTQIIADPQDIQILEDGAALPKAVVPAAPLSYQAARSYNESLEGMLVRLASGNVVGPTNARLESYLIASSSGRTRIFRNDPLRYRVLRISNQGLFELQPQVRVGDNVLDLLGVLDFSIGAYTVHLVSAPTVVSNGTDDPPEIPYFSDAGLATVNLHNLFDTIDDPDYADPVRSAADYRRDLEKLARTISLGLGEPLLVAVQEAENSEVLQALVNRPEIEAHYEFIHADGPDFRGIDVALLYQPGRVEILTWSYDQGCTGLADGLGPDGNYDVVAPENQITCSTRGQGVLDGNRLFSRPVLVVHAEICTPFCGPYPGRKLWIVINHWKSKSNDSATVEHTLPRRTEQASFVADLVRDIFSQDANAEVVVLGDFNDFGTSEPLLTLEGTGLINLSALSVNYTYIFDGLSQSLDHILVSPNLLKPVDVSIVPMVLHANADYPVIWEGQNAAIQRASDHDPLLLAFLPVSHFAYLPLAMEAAR